jgi:hypothetical protein
MKNFATAFVVCFFVGPVSFGKSISAQKIKELPRSTTIASGMIPAPKGESDWRNIDQILGENAKYENKDQNFKIDSGKKPTPAICRGLFFLTKGAGKKEPLASEPLAYVYILSGGENQSLFFGASLFTEGTQAFSRPVWLRCRLSGVGKDHRLGNCVLDG